MRRFPLVMLAAALKTLLLCLLISLPNSATLDRPFLIRPLLALSLALPLSLSLHLVAERRKWRRGLLAFGALGLIALLIFYFLTISHAPIQRDYYRFGMFLVGSHMLVSFAPFIGYDEPNGFWQFNKTMLLQFLTATLYAGTLYLGILVAVETIRFLFVPDFSVKVELYIFAFISGFLHTIFFLNGFPAQLDELENQNVYSRGLKVFTQYVLLPLEVVYLLILYFYSFQIILRGQLPYGGVAYLVIAFSVAGTFALLLLYPIRDSTDEPWIRIFSRRFHLALFPLIVLLIVAIYRRIEDYGVTENRYLVAALAVWLTGITLYFLISKKDDIRWIPLSLCVFSFSLAVGPWSIFAYSRQNQRTRFDEILTEYKLLDKEGKLIGGSVPVPVEKSDQLISSIRYFRDRHEINVLRPFFNAVPPSDDQTAVANSMEVRVRNAMYSKAVAERDTNTKRSTLYSSVSFNLAESENIYGTDIKGFDHLLVFQVFGGTERREGPWAVNAGDDGATLVVTKSNKEIARFDIAGRMAVIERKYGNSVWGIEHELLTLDQPNARVVLENISRNENSYTYDGVVMMKDQ